MQVVLAADVLYDDALTAAFCSFLEVFLAAARSHRKRQLHGGSEQGPPTTSCATPLGSAADAQHHALPRTLSRDGPGEPDGQSGGPSSSSPVMRAADGPSGQGWTVHEGAPLVLVAAERRYVFTLDDADVRAPAFERFLEHVRIVPEQPGGGQPAGGKGGAAGGVRVGGGARTGRQAGLCGRFIDWQGLPRRVGGGRRSEGLVLMQLWLAE